MTPDTPLLDRCFPISLFSGCFDNRPLVQDFRYRALVTMLGRFEKREEKDGEAFAPVSYSKPRRANKNVEKVSLAVLDYDDGTPIDDARKRFRPFEFLLYTSFSHTDERHRFRVVFPLAKPIDAGDWGCAWQHLAQLAPGLDDACKDPARMYYLPSHRPGAPHVSLRNEGKLLDLPTTIPVSPRRPKRRQWCRLNVNRKGEIEKPSWSGRAYHRAVPRSLEDWLDDHGVRWEVLSRAGRRYLALSECPWAHEHGQKSKSGDAVVFEGDGGQWCFHCFHAHCASRGWRDFRAAVE